MVMGPIEQLAALAQPILNIGTIRRIRRNHGLEHATIHLLGHGKARFRMSGRSDSHGFYLLGNATAEEIERASAEALRRMRAGHHELAVHPSCGTNLLTSGVMASLAALTSAAGMDRTWRDRFERFPTVVLMVMGALLLAPGLGTAFQRHFTTLGEPGDLVVRSVERREWNGPLGKTTVHRVETTGG